mmetsp:Transcript_48306/g.139948  ORF Transcript_48306/g.139948 Transcript_48306/m.139948 type:complete len:210 (-) Transcript_48306:40-669(-)
MFSSRCEVRPASKSTEPAAAAAWDACSSHTTSEAVLPTAVHEASAASKDRQLASSSVNTARRLSESFWCRRRAPLCSPMELPGAAARPCSSRRASSPSALPVRAASCALRVLGVHLREALSSCACFRMWTACPRTDSMSSWTLRLSDASPAPASGGCRSGAASAWPPDLQGRGEAWSSRPGALLLSRLSELQMEGLQLPASSSIGSGMP